MFDRLRVRHSAITFDVGSTGVRACQLTAHGRRVAVRDFLSLNVPPAAVRDDAPETAAGEPLAQVRATAGTAPVENETATSADSGDRVLDRASRMVEQGMFQGRDAALVLAPPEVRFHTLRLPDALLSQPEERIRAALAFEVARETRCEPAGVEVRHWPLPAGHQQGLNVMAVSIPQRRAMEWVDAFERRNLNLRRLDVSPCAVVRAARRGFTPSPKDLWATLECGYRQSILTVVIGEQIAYVRCLPTSTQDWTRRLANAFDVTYEDAVELKRTHGIGNTSAAATSGESSQNPRDEELPAVIFRVLRDSLDSLVREIDLCCSYVMRSYSDLNVSRLIIAGGGGALAGLPDYLGLHLGVPVESIAVVDDSAPASADSRAMRCDSAVALGGAYLALEAA